jgi:hypothetical protein
MYVFFSLYQSLSFPFVRLEQQPLFTRVTKQSTQITNSRCLANIAYTSEFRLPRHAAVDLYYQLNIRVYSVQTVFKCYNLDCNITSEPFGGPIRFLVTMSHTQHVALKKMSHVLGC